jgi:hypothetical protein
MLVLLGCHTSVIGHPATSGTLRPTSALPQTCDIRMARSAFFKVEYSLDPFRKSKAVVLDAYHSPVNRNLYIRDYSLQAAY